jgi:hypothetical protein
MASGLPYDSMELPFALVVITAMLDTWSKLSSKYASVSGNGLSLVGLYLDGSKNAYPLPAYGTKPVVLEMLPQTLAESPYAAKDGFAAVKAAAPCVRKRRIPNKFRVRFFIAPKKKKLDTISPRCSPIDKKKRKKKIEKEKTDRARKEPRKRKKKSDETIDSREEQPNPLEYRKI